MQDTCGDQWRTHEDGCSVHRIFRLQFLIWTHSSASSQSQVSVAFFKQPWLLLLSHLLTNVIFGIRAAWDRGQLVSWAEPYWLQTRSGAVWELSLLQPQALLWHTCCHAWAPFEHGSRQKAQNCALLTTGFKGESNSSAAQRHTMALLHQSIPSSLNFFMHRMCTSL